MWENSSAYSRVRFEDIATNNNQKYSKYWRSTNLNKPTNNPTPTTTLTPIKSSQWHRPTTITPKTQNFA